MSVMSMLCIKLQSVLVFGVLVIRKPIKIHKYMKAIYGDGYMDVKSVCLWDRYPCRLKKSIFHHDNSKEHCSQQIAQMIKSFKIALAEQPQFDVILKLKEVFHLVLKLLCTIGSRNFLYKMKKLDETFLNKLLHHLLLLVIIL